MTAFPCPRVGDFDTFDNYFLPGGGDFDNFFQKMSKSPPYARLASYSAQRSVVSV